MSQPSVVNRALAHVRSSWGEDGPYRAIALDELADAAGVSVGHLSRTFRSEFGTGPSAALERLRLVRAASLLRADNRSIEAIARWCGFADQYHFSHRFSLVCGLPPSVHRQGTASGRFREPLAEGQLVRLAAAILPTTLIEQRDPTPSPPPLPPGRTFAQTFTVPSPMVLSRVCLQLATWYSRDSSATVTVHRIAESGVATTVASRRLSPMIDNAAEWITFAAQEFGQYRIELSDAVGTPTWLWHQGPDIVDVGGGAEMDGVAIRSTNFLFTATVSG